MRTKTIKVGRTLEDKKWGEVVYDPKVTPGGRVPDLMVNTYGLEPPMVWLPSKTTPRWSRTCEDCGRVEHTTATREIAITAGGLKVTRQVPDFGGHR